MNSLTKLDISWCDKLSILPEFRDSMKKLTVLDARRTTITKLPESLGFLSGLRDLNLRGPRKLVLQMSVFNPTSLTMLNLSYCGISDGAIPEDLGGLSSLITLHVEGSDFTNLPTGCFSNLFQLLHLYLNNCERLKSLPKLPPRLIKLYATGCDSMELLSSDGMWNKVSSLDHEYRHRTNYEKRVLRPIQSGYVPEADFLAIMPKSESGFPNRGSIPSNESGTSEYELVVDIPPYFHASNWSGLVVCLEIKDRSTCDKLLISWSCKAPEDHYLCKEWENEISLAFAWQPPLCLMLLDLNERTCWQHLRGGDYCLHIKLSVSSQYSKIPQLKYGWWALCKEEIQKCGNTTIDSNRLTEAEHNSCPGMPALGQGSSYGERNVSSSINSDFKLLSEARKIPCNHIYNPDCAQHNSFLELPPTGQGSSQAHEGRNVNNNSNFNSSRRQKNNQQNQGRRDSLLAWWPI